MVTQRLFHQDFTLVILGQIISLLGNAILSFALPLHLLKVTGSGTIFGVVMALSIIPTIILSPIGGLIADRVNRRNIMVVLDFITCLIVLLSSFFIKDRALVCISTTLMLLSIIRSFYQPAVQASVPAITTSENLLKANSVVNMVSSVSMLLGPIIGGTLYGFLGITPIIIIGGMAFFLSAVMELFIKIPFIKQPVKSNIILTLKQDFSESIYFITKEKPIIAKTIGIASLINMVLTSLLMIGIPFIINITLGLSSELYGIAQSAMGIGALIGGILVGVFASKLTQDCYYKLLLWASLAIIPIGLVLLLPISAMGAFAIITLVTVIVLIFATMVSIVIITSIQQITPQEMTGKVMSLVMTVSMCASPIGQAVYGYLFDNVSELYWIIFGAVMILIFIVGSAKKVWNTSNTMV